MSLYAFQKRRVGRNGRWLCHGIVLLFVATCCVPLFAQEETDLSKKSIEELMNIEVYTASRRSQSVADAPVPVTVITSEEIQKHGYRNMADLIRNVRSFYINYDRNYQYIGVRGNMRAGDYNTHVLVMIDGHRINDNVYYQGSVGNELPLDIDLVDRVEIIRGPGSSMYGTNAFWGVINIITKTPKQLKGWEFSFDRGSFGTNAGRATYGGSIKGAQVMVSGTFADSAGQNLFIPYFNSPETNNGVAVGADYEQRHDLIATVTMGNFTWQGVSGSRNKGIPTAEYNTEFNNPLTHNRDQYQYMNLSYRRPLENGELFAKVTYDRYAYDASWMYPGNEEMVDYTRGQSWGAELQWDRQLWSKHTLTLGTELRDNFQQDQKTYDVAPYFAMFLDDRRDSWLGAVYIEDEYRISGKWMVNAGVRYDRYSEWGGSSNPRLALMYKPFANTSIKLIYGSAFRIPNAYEAHYGGGESGYMINPSIKPETTKNLELVWEQGLGRRFRISTGAFRSQGKGILSIQLDPASGNLMFVNSAASNVTGTSMELTASLPGSIESRVNYTFTKSVDSDATQVLFSSPAHLGKVNITAPLWQKKLFLGFDAQYESSRTAINGQRTGGYPLLNVTVSTPVIGKHFRVSGSIYNFLDRRYSLPVDEEFPSLVIPQDGRSARLKLTYTF